MGYRSGFREEISSCTLSCGLIPCCMRVSLFLRILPKNEKFKFYGKEMAVFLVGVFKRE